MIQLTLLTGLHKLKYFFQQENVPDKLLKIQQFTCLNNPNNYNEFGYFATKKTIFFQPTVPGKLFFSEYAWKATSLIPHFVEVC